MLIQQRAQSIHERVHLLHLIRADDQHDISVAGDAYDALRGPGQHPAEVFALPLLRRVS